MIYITGDMHGAENIDKLSNINFPEQKGLTKDDYLIVLGDFGALWYGKSSESYKEDKKLQDWYKKKNFTTLFVDGNHENHYEINKLPEVEMFGGTVGKVNDSIYHLKRGQIYNIGGKKIFTFGGANSIDKMFRRPYISWWSEELPTCLEMNKGVDNLANHNMSVDYVLTHCCPSSIMLKINEAYMVDTETDYFDMLKDKINFKHWYFGHYHIDKDITDKFTCLYNTVVRLD